MSLAPPEGDRPERGVTLVELLVTMAILLLVGGIVLGFLEQTTSLVQRTSNDVQAETDARLALRTMTQDIRAAATNPSIGFSSAAYPACPATPAPGTCLGLVIKRGTTANPNCRSTVTYWLTADGVRQTRGDTGCASNLSVDRVLIGGVANGTTPLFTYYDKQGNQLSSGQAAASSIRIELLVTYQGAQSPLTFTSTLALRNAR
jgi:prepilin-type N-terminal cleavage/methylation domain-containing protein